MAKILLTNDEINEIACRFLSLRTDTGKLTTVATLTVEQNQCVQQLRFLIYKRLWKYKKFTNFPDLEQDGLEALILALNTYNSAKGAFSWWADKYINTRIARAANQHSTIRIPIKQARETPPFKTTGMPVMVDHSYGPQEFAERQERVAQIQRVLKSLPLLHREVIGRVYGLNGIRERSVVEVANDLQLPHNQCLKILREAKNQLKNILVSSEELMP